MVDLELLILDELVIGLDFIVWEKLLDMIIYIVNKENVLLIFYVIYYVEEILLVFDKVFLLKQGEVFKLGVIKEMFIDYIFFVFFDMLIYVLWNQDWLFLIRVELIMNV